MRIRIRSRLGERLRKAIFERATRSAGALTIDFRDGHAALYLLDRVGQEVVVTIDEASEERMLIKSVSLPLAHEVWTATLVSRAARAT